VLILHRVSFLHLSRIEKRERERKRVNKKHKGNHVCFHVTHHTSYFIVENNWSHMMRRFHRTRGTFCFCFLFRFKPNTASMIIQPIYICRHIVLRLFSSLQGHTYMCIVSRSFHLYVSFPQIFILTWERPYYLTIAWQSEVSIAQVIDRNIHRYLRSNITATIIIVLADSHESSICFWNGSPSMKCTIAFGTALRKQFAQA
jgi:hypothetical protein